MKQPSDDFPKWVESVETFLAVIGGTLMIGFIAGMVYALWTGAFR